MYKVYADDALIYDSTLDDYKIQKASITLEINKSGSFTFAIYPDHFYYDSFVRLKTVITVYKSGRIIFRGRVLNDTVDYWNNKVLTCEGELGFLQDSIIRPFSFTGSPSVLFRKFINDHNNQVDDFKKFKIGNITVANNYVTLANTGYETALSNLNTQLVENVTGGYLYITHGDDGTDPIPTINYLADFTRVSTQIVEFGSNLKNYTKTVKADDLATAIIPLGATVENKDLPEGEEAPKLTIVSINDGNDYVYDKAGVALYGWIFKTVSFDEVNNASVLKAKALEYLKSVMRQAVTIELTAIDLHLLDRSIESFHICDYIRVISKPHNFDSTLLCNKQTIDLLKPDNDSLTLGASYSTFTEKISKSSNSVLNVNSRIASLNATLNTVNQTVVQQGEKLENMVTTTGSWIAGDTMTVQVGTVFAGHITNNTKNIVFTVPVGSPIQATNAIASGAITVRGISGYVTQASYTAPLSLSDSKYTVSAEIADAAAGLINVTVIWESNFSNITANTPISVTPGSEFTITFAD